jgi:hypothetical protein
VVTYTSVPEEPQYIDYGMNVVYEGDTAYVDNKPVPVEQRDGPILDAVANVAQPPPPMPPTDPKQKSEWLPLGVFALAQEERGDPVMFFQLSINKEGLVSGGFVSTLTGDSRAGRGQARQGKPTRARRIGDNGKTVYETSLANDPAGFASPVHFEGPALQTWLLVDCLSLRPPVNNRNFRLRPSLPPPLKTARWLSLRSMSCLTGA